MWFLENDQILRIEGCLTEKLSPTQYIVAGGALMMFLEPHKCWLSEGEVGGWPWMRLVLSGSHGLLWGIPVWTWVIFLLSLRTWRNSVRNWQQWDTGNGNRDENFLKKLVLKSRSIRKYKGNLLLYISKFRKGTMCVIHYHLLSTYHMTSLIL
jgi:hypothetical protein